MSAKKVLSLSSPQLLAVFCDFPVMERWERLRRCGEEMTVQRFAAACAIDLEEAQRTLDRLVAAGLVARLRAARTRKKIAYQTAAAEIAITWNPSVSEQRDAVTAQNLHVRNMSREILDQNLAPAYRDSKVLPCWFGFASVMLTPEEIAQVHRMLQSAFEVIIAADLRAESRARGEYSGDIAAESELLYHLAMESRPLKAPVPLIPAFELWDERSMPKEIERAKNAPGRVLSARELEIARRLAAGKSRPAIAKELGISLNTVATNSKRIHVKLGVHTRAELTARLKGV